MLVVGIVVSTGLGVFLLREGRENADQWSSIFGFFLNIASFLLTIYTMVGIRRGLATDQVRPDADYLENLATMVSEGYTAESSLRRLQDPDLLPVDWAPADRDLMDHPTNIWPGSNGHSPHLRPTTSILETYLQVPTGRLVVLGRPGAGKTVAALTFATESLAVRLAGEPVPVVLSLSTWDPESQDFRDWICGRLTELDPRLSELDRDGVPWARRLVDRRGILPVLDGLDELPTRLKAGVLRTLNAVLDRDEHIVLTSRTPQYRAGVQAGDVLTGAAVIELQPLRPDTLADYLPRTTKQGRTASAGTKWAPVLDNLRDRPDSPSSRSLAEVLSTPLMVWLARVQYSDTEADPARLLHREFREPRALRLHLLDGLVAAAYADPGRHRRLRVSAASAEQWLADLAALLDRRGSHNLRWWEMPDILAGRAVRVVLAATTAVLATVAATVVLGLRNGLERGLLLGALFGLIAGAAIWFIPWLHRRPAPAAVGSVRSTRSIRQVNGILVVALIPVAAISLSWLRVVDRADNMASVVAMLISVLAAVVAVPAPPERAVDPFRLLRADKASAIAQGCLIGMAAGILAGAGAWTVFPTGVALGVGAVLAISAGLVWAIVGSAWGRFLVAQVSWWATGRLPLGLMAFLADAHQRGILRQVGAAYQFRHESLQTHLATRQLPQRTQASPL
ncbi:hypothetical protein Ate02nite_95810 [Paractinoplanes tereljensis]|uniref:NACHT domain-containing protein n=1 Tax=Paractinoplanes tereljensis TaxID=571912 RepID=A0A919NWY0_9ACTN|nr:hypothetical protein Ate02nite_95810 [Actinoplanes tereljensis]